MFLNYAFMLTFQKIVDACSLSLRTEDVPSEDVSPCRGLPMPHEDTRGLKGCVVFGQLVFPREADPVLALITLKIAKR